MEIDYYARNYIGAQVTVDDFMDTVVKNVTMCHHEEAIGCAFCPMCGRRQDQRQMTKSKQVWKPVVMDMLKDDDKVFSFDELIGDKSTISRFGFFELNTSSYDSCNRFIYGLRLSNVCGEGDIDKNPTSIDFSTIATTRSLNLTAS